MMKDLLKKLQKKSNKKGFTLVEIIVVLVILAILAAIAVPSVIGYVDEAKESRYIQEARSIYVVIQTEEAKCEALTTNQLTYNATTNPDGIYAGSGTAITDSSNVLLKKIKDTTSLTVKELTPTYTEGNATTKANSTQWVVTWKSDDGKGIKATIKKNKDIKITSKNESVD